MSRIPFYKAHKVARRIATRNKESARTVAIRRDDASKPATRRARRYGAACAAILAIALTHATPACAWPTGGTSGGTSGGTHRTVTAHARGSVHVGHGETSSAIAAFRSRYGQN